MPGAFDPYHTWLGIPPAEQPPNHYRLLGLPLFEQQPEVIEHAADQRMVHLHALQTGKHAKLADRLLSEVAAARVCLLHAEKKAAYDRQLGDTLRAEVAGAVRPPPVHADLTGQKTVTYRPDWAQVAASRQATAESTALGELGEYELLEKLGEGGMGAVYKARHTKLKRIVALKVLPRGRREDDRAIARFEREMEAVGRLDHPNVVRAHDAREVEGTRFLVMEYVEGLDLGKVLRHLGPLSVPNACELVRQAALGLQSAHEHGLVHRDVKPSNLMLTARGEVKLLDLGLARFQSDPEVGAPPAGEEMTGTGQAVGTLDYMAPEQVSDTHSVDIRADIYALGCTLYKLLTGQTPFSGPRYESSFAKMQAHLLEPVPPIRQFRADVPEGLTAVIERMLAKDPAGRFATPAEVADAVGPLATGNDLPGLLARAAEKPPVVRPSRSLEATAGPPSSGLTRFLERMQIKPPPPPPGSEPPGAEPPRWARPAIIVGSAAVGVLSLAILIAWAVKSGGGPSEPATALVFDWPQTERKETTVLIGQREFRLPASGPLTVRCQPGEYRIRAVREGFQTNERRITVEAGKPTEVVPFEGWVPLAPPPQSYLVLQWPEAERADAKLEIDGRPRDVAAEPIQSTPEQVKVPLPPGSHRLWIVRRGASPFEQQFTVFPGKDTEIRVEFAGGPPPEKLPVPADEVQQKIARRIEQTHGLSAAQTAEQQLALAGKLLELGKQTAEKPEERFILLRKAMELATAAGDAAMMLQAVEALGAAFQVDLPAERQRAVAEFVRTATPPPKVFSLLEADGFARTAIQSPQIAALAAAAGRVAVADVYWDLAEKEADASKSALVLCAGHWYEQAQAEAASAELKDKLTLRLRDVAQIKAAIEQTQAQAERERQYAEALRPVEAMVSAWDFRGAATALAKLERPEPELAARLARRRDEVKRLAALKGKIAQKINGQEPPYRKSDLMIPGLPGNLARAEETAITVKLDNGKSESLRWEMLGEKAVERLLGFAVDPKGADDQFAAGLLALACQDTASAERYFAQARSLGGQIDPYLAPLAAASFAEAQGSLKEAQLLLEKGQFAQAKARFTAADAAVTNIEEKYAKIPWFGANKNGFGIARQQAKAGVSEAEGEELYAEAAKQFAAKELFDLKPLVEKLKTEYPNTAPVNDTQRKPAFAELEKAVADLGKQITVRQDGKGDFKSIQAAIDAVPANSLIEIQDNGAYLEKIEIAKPGLTLRGRRGSWPIVSTSAAASQSDFCVVGVNAPRITLQRLAIVRSNPSGRSLNCVGIFAGTLRIRLSIIYMDNGNEAFLIRGGAQCDIEDCVVIAILSAEGQVTLTNSLLLGSGTSSAVNLHHEKGGAELRSCTVPSTCELWTSPHALLDCIIGGIVRGTPEDRIEHCDIFGNPPFSASNARAGRASFSGDPQFRDPGNLDYRLMRGSPCIGKASDGGDLGCRFTPEMIEIIEVARKLRAQGLIKF